MPEDISDPMEYIWERVPKNAQGYIHYLAGDIPYLYLNGFVDSIRFTYEQWKKAFDDCLQSDGSYLVSKQKFFSLRVFRYTGPLYEPFDPKKVREGEWVDADLKKLFSRSIQPSSSITSDIFWNSVTALKKQGFVSPQGNLIVNKAVKTQLAYLIDRFPSPRRRLEKEVSRLKKEQEEEEIGITKQRDTSLFTTGKTTSNIQAEKLEKLQSSSPVRASQINTLPLKKSGGEIDIKKLQKPRSKIKG